MKTITLKADQEFDAMLARLAVRLDTSRSAVIREAVRRYEQALEREDLVARVREASRRTREQALRTAEDFDETSADGL